MKTWMAGTSPAMTQNWWLDMGGTFSGLEQLHSGRQRQAAGQALHFLLHDRFGLAARVAVRSHDQVLDDLGLVRLEQRGVEAHALPLACGRQRDGHEPAAGGAFDLDAVELGLHRLHFGLEFRGLLHQAHEIRHR